MEINELASPVRQSAVHQSARNDSDFLQGYKDYHSMFEMHQCPFSDVRRIANWKAGWMSAQDQELDTGS
jgi:ribosome modulation factor